MIKKMLLVFTFTLVLLQIFTISAQGKQGNFIEEYIVGARDLLEIKVFESPELNQTVRVSEDGSITIPLLGKVMVGGITKDAVEKKIAALLDEKYVKNAKVSVFIKEFQSNTISIIGAVNNPGMYELIGKRTLLQMISQAGGFSENVGDSLFILRLWDTGETASLSINLEDLMEKGNQNLNIPLRPNDVINVPEDKFIKIFVFGSVKRAGALTVRESEKITLLQAIAQAGGLDEWASNKVLIKRKNENGKDTEIKAKLKNIINGTKPDIELKKGDLVYVHQTRW